MSLLTKEDAIKGYRIDGHVIQARGETIWVRSRNGQEHSIKWQWASEDVLPGHQISAFIGNDGDARQVRNYTTGNVFSTFAENLKDNYSWAGVAMLGEKAAFIALIPLFNYYIAFMVGVISIFKNPKVFLKAGALLALLTLPLLWLTAGDARMRIEQVWVGRPVILMCFAMLAWLAFFGMRLAAKGKFFTRIVGLLIFASALGFAWMNVERFAYCSGLNIMMFELNRMTWCYDSIVESFRNSFMPYVVLAWAPTLAIVYACKAMAHENIRVHNAAVQRIEAVMA